MNKNVQTVNKESLFMLLSVLDELSAKYWVEGGWGIDILLGKQTRAHRDLDVDMDAHFVEQFLEKLCERGYEIVAEQRPTRIELYRRLHGYIDVHPLILMDIGGAKQANPAGGWFELAAAWFGSAQFEGRQIPCITAEGQESSIVDMICVRWIRQTLQT